MKDMLIPTLSQYQWLTYAELGRRVEQFGAVDWKQLVLSSIATFSSSFFFFFFFSILPGWISTTGCGNDFCCNSVGCYFFKLL